MQEHRRAALLLAGTALLWSTGGLAIKSVNLSPMDWRRPCFAPHGFDILWGSDILYETRFYDPLVTLFHSLLVPGGRIWLSEPWREVSASVWERLAADGFRVTRVHEEPVAFSTYRSTVSIYEIIP